MLKEEVIDRIKRTADVCIVGIKPRASINYSGRGSAYLSHWIVYRLLGRKHRNSLLSAGKTYRDGYKVEKKQGTNDYGYPTKIRMLHSMILAAIQDEEILSDLAEYRKETMSFKPWFFHTFVLANYMLGNYEKIEQHKDEIVSVEEKKGGNHLIYTAWTKAILALAHEDEENFKKHIESILAEHKLMQRRGLRNSPLGEICLPAISLLKLAKKVGMNIDVNNPLAPTDLVDLHPL